MDIYLVNPLLFAKYLHHFISCLSESEDLFIAKSKDKFFFYAINYINSMFIKSVLPFDLKQIEDDNSNSMEDNKDNYDNINDKEKNDDKKEIKIGEAVFMGSFSLKQLKEIINNNVDKLIVVFDDVVMKLFTSINNIYTFNEVNSTINNYEVIKDIEDAYNNDENTLLSINISLHYIRLVLLNKKGQDKDSSIRLIIKEDKYTNGYMGKTLILVTESNSSYKNILIIPEYKNKTQPNINNQNNNNNIIDTPFEEEKEEDLEDFVRKNIKRRKVNDTRDIEFLENIQYMKEKTDEYLKKYNNTIVKFSHFKNAIISFMGQNLLDYVTISIYKNGAVNVFHDLETGYITTIIAPREES